MKGVVLASCVGGASLLAAAVAARADIITVHIYSFDFSVNPQGQPVVDPVINVGDTIRWLWDATPHTTTSVQGIPEQWNSFFQPLGATFDHTFTNTGVFWYYCIPHGFDRGDGTAGGMSGTITVVPSPAAGLPVMGLGALALGRRRRR